MKKVKLFFLVSFLVSFCMIEAKAEGFIIDGDVDGDGNVTSADITVLYNYLLNNDEAGIVNGDIDGDGYITSADVTIIYNILLGDVPVSHGWVDLGLPSGTLWATMNIGASSPEEYGDHFAWGETEPKDVYKWNTYKWCYVSHNLLTKYCTNSMYGYSYFVDYKTELDPEDDAVTANWGPEWCMPSIEQIQELRDNCTKIWTTKNGGKGRMFTSNINGASLFLPAAGNCWESSLNDAGSWGYYWSRSLNTSCPSEASSLYFGSGGVFWNYFDRSYGFTVRAVSAQ